MELIFGLVVMVCVMTLLWLLARAVYRWARPHGVPTALAASAGSVCVAYAFLAALAR